MIYDIIYVFAIPSWEPREVTLFQGFAPGMIELAMLLVDLPRLPADLGELTMDIPDRLARRRAGQGNWVWSPIKVDSLIRHARPTSAAPFMVVFTANREVARRVSTWRRGLRIRPLHVSAEEIGGAISPADMTVERLQRHCRNVLRQVKQLDHHADIDEEMGLIDAWRAYQPFDPELRLHSHNVTRPNETVLESCGAIRPQDVEGRLIASPEEEYLEAIVESAHAVLDLHAQTANRPLYALNPPRPDVFLLAPGMNTEVGSLMGRAPIPAVAKRAFRTMERRRGFTLDFRMDGSDTIDQVGPMLSYRGAELKTTTYAVGLRAASTLAATLRLPPSVSRTAGVVGHLARFVRAHENPPATKAPRVFKAVQDALAVSVPEAFMEVIRRSRSGVKIIGEAPLEWLSLDGVPLGIARDVSRIGTLPGNLFLEQLRNVDPAYIHSEAFKQYLVLSMFEDNDGIAHDIRRALTALPGASGAGITGISKTPRTSDEFIEAVNAYEGPVLIIDSHGAHPEAPNVGGLVIGGQLVDIWQLCGRLKPPPIVILSACDTHPFDRSHMTVANGFLACGATAVLATVLPVRSRDAAMFLVRLMLRAIQFGDAMNGIGRSAPWTNIVGGALRMQLASDILRGLVELEMIPVSKKDEMHVESNFDLNPPRLRDDWMPRLRDRCMVAGGFGLEAWERAYADILAASDVIRYVHMGNPEAILISDERVMRQTMIDSGLLEEE